jgi:hypothetical protein
MVKAGLSPLEVIKAATSTSAEVLGVKDLGTLAVGKTADFFALTQNPLSDMVNSKEIDKIYKNGQELPRLPLIQNITIEAPRITQADRNADAAAQVEEARAAAEARLPHFGKWPLGKSQMVRAMPIPMPMRSSSSVTVGPPDRITVKMRDASAADLTTFFSKALVNYNWKPASGGCFERIHSISKKTETLCVQASPNSAVLTITER